MFKTSLFVFLFLTAAVSPLTLIPAAQAREATAQHEGVGTVKSVDSSKSMVTLAHEPIASLGWPAMTMAFTVKDKALLSKFTPGAKVTFVLAPEGSNMVIVGVK